MPAKTKRRRALTPEQLAEQRDAKRPQPIAELRKEGTHPTLFQFDTPTRSGWFVLTDAPGKIGTHVRHAPGGGCARADVHKAAECAIVKAPAPTKRVLTKPDATPKVAPKTAAKG